MRAVSNTSPISNLAVIGKLELLRNQFSAVMIPPAVVDELQNHPDVVAQDAIQRAMRDGWIQARPAPTSQFLGVLLAQLHRGEAEAIALAAELSADRLLIDEQEGRQLAVRSGLAITGVLGVLLRAKKVGQISSMTAEIRALRKEAHFFIAPALEKEILLAAGE